jgi:hypothetical protein
VIGKNPRRANMTTSKPEFDLVKIHNITSGFSPLLLSIDIAFAIQLLSPTLFTVCDASLKET